MNEVLQIMVSSIFVVLTVGGFLSSAFVSLFINKKRDGEKNFQESSKRPIVQIKEHVQCCATRYPNGGHRIRMIALTAVSVVAISCFGILVARRYLYDTKPEPTEYYLSQNASPTPEMMQGDEITSGKKLFPRMEALRFREDGMVKSIYNSLSHSIDANDMVIITYDNGAVAAFGRVNAGESSKSYDITEWNEKNIIQAIDCSEYVAALTSQHKAVLFPYRYGEQDGVVATNTSINDLGIVQAESWDDIFQLAGTSSFLAGITHTGNVIVAGQKEPYLKDAEKWENIQQISVGRHYIIGVDSDNKAHVTFCELQNEIDQWDNIVQVVGDTEPNYDYALGLRKDGTIATAGNLKNYGIDISNWTDVIYLCARSGNVIGLRSDGTLLATGNASWLSSLGWTDLIEIDVGKNFAIGLHSDGSVVTKGERLGGWPVIDGLRLWND